MIIFSIPSAEMSKIRLEASLQVEVMTYLY